MKQQHETEMGRTESGGLLFGESSEHCFSFLFTCGFCYYHVLLRITH